MQVKKHLWYALSGMLWFATIACGQVNSQPAPAEKKAGVNPSLNVYPLDTILSPDGGSAYVVDRNLPGLWKFSDGKLNVFSQGSKRFREPLNAARCLAWDHNGKLLVGDTSTRDIYRCDDTGKATPITGGMIGTPMDIAVKKDGTIYVADLETRYLLRIPPNSTKVEQVAPVNPRGVFVDLQQRVWVVSQDVQQLIIVSDDGKKDAVVGKRVFEFPHQVVVNSAGEAFVSDGYKKAIWKVTQGTQPTIVVQGPPLDNPVGLALHNDQIYITDPRAAKVFRLDKEAKLQEWFAITK